MKIATILRPFSISTVIAIALLVAQTSTAATHTITFGNDFRYTPETLSGVKVGDVVTWEGDFSAHPLRFDVVPEGATKPADVTSGNSFSYTIEKEGTYSYFCILHVSGGMAGGFVAQAAARVDDPLSVKMLSIFPNPVHQDSPLRVELGFEAPLISQVNLCDMEGICGSFIAGTGYRIEGTTVVIPNTSWGSGSYVLAISTTNGEIYRRKLVITR